MLVYEMARAESIGGVCLSLFVCNPFWMVSGKFARRTIAQRLDFTLSSSMSIAKAAFFQLQVLWNVFQRPILDV